MATRYKYKTKLNPTFEKIFSDFRKADERQNGALTARGVTVLRAELARLQEQHPKWKGVLDYYQHLRFERATEDMLSYTQR